MKNIVFDIKGSEVTLVERTVDCNSLTSDEFVQMLMEDMTDAEKQYAEIVVPEIKKYSIECIKKYNDPEKTKKWAEEFAEKKYKTIRRRISFVEEEVNKKKTEVEKEIEKINSRTYKLAFFDFDPNCGTQMGISGACVLDSDADAKVVGACFNKMKESDFFKVALGWKVCYTKSERSLASAFRPHIELILPPEVEE